MQLSDIKPSALKLFAIAGLFISSHKSVTAQSSLAKKPTTEIKSDGVEKILADNFAEYKGSHQKVDTIINGIMYTTVDSKVGDDIVSSEFHGPDLNKSGDLQDNEITGAEIGIGALDPDNYSEIIIKKNGNHYTGVVVIPDKSTEKPLVINGENVGTEMESKMSEDIKGTTFSQVVKAAKLKM